MKTSRLLAYGIAGVITGLIVENGALRLKAKGGRKLREAKNETGKAIEKLRGKK